MRLFDTIYQNAISALPSSVSQRESSVGRVSSGMNVLSVTADDAADMSYRTNYREDPFAFGGRNGREDMSNNMSDCDHKAQIVAVIRIETHENTSSKAVIEIFRRGANTYLQTATHTSQRDLDGPSVRLRHVHWPPTPILGHSVLRGSNAGSFCVTHDLIDPYREGREEH